MNEEKKMPEAIFDLTRKDWKYKGILFAELDNNEVFAKAPFMNKSNEENFKKLSALDLWL